MEVSKTEIVAYNKTEQALAELRTKYSAVVFDVKSTKGMGAAKEARAELRTYRVDLEKVRVLEKAESLAYGRLVDYEAKRITAELEKLEDPIDDMIKVEEKRKADEKAEKERIEKERVNTIRARISDIERWPLRCIGMSAEKLGIEVDVIASEPISEKVYMELREEALKAWEQADIQIRAMYSAKLEEEAKAEEQRLETIRLDELRKADELRIKAERAELKAKKDKLDQERKAEDDRIKAERDKAAAEIAAELEALSKIRAEREAEEARIAAISAEEAAKSERPRIAEQETERMVSGQEKGYAIIVDSFLPETVKQPSNAEIIEVLSDHFVMTDGEVVHMLLNMHLETCAV